MISKFARTKNVKPAAPFLYRRTAPSDSTASSPTASTPPPSDTAASNIVLFTESSQTDNSAHQILPSSSISVKATGSSSSDTSSLKPSNSKSVSKKITDIPPQGSLRPEPSTSSSTAGATEKQKNSPALQLSRPATSRVKMSPFYPFLGLPPMTSSFLETPPRQEQMIFMDETKSFLHLHRELELYVNMHIEMYTLCFAQRRVVAACQPTWKLLGDQVTKILQMSKVTGQKDLLFQCRDLFVANMRAMDGIMAKAIADRTEPEPPLFYTGGTLKKKVRKL